MTRLGLLLLAACGSATVPLERAPGGVSPIDPGTAAAELLSAAACARCHPAEHAEWSRSRHALAWTNGIFRREYRENPRAWCIHCHAPLAPQVAEARAGGGPLADEGVGCASCHVRRGRIVARSRGAASPHDTLVSSAFGGADFCGGCHQFPFPIFDDDGEVRRLTAFPMQATVAQFHRGPFAGAAEACRTCHTPHVYPGAHDPGMLAGALAFDVCRDGDALAVRLLNRGAGHHVPSGDVHRHVLVRVWRPTAPERLFEAYVGRRFTPAPEGGKRTTWDSTLAPGEARRYRVPLVDLGGEEGEPVAYELRYVYVRDEHPRKALGEPASRAIADGRAQIQDLVPCAP